MSLAWPGKSVVRISILGLSGALVGILLSISPWGRHVEERFGLHWLFQLRGPVDPPSEVILVSIDKASSDALGVPYDTSRWPRELHTRLVNGLHDAGARSVTFDLHFRQAREAEDPAFIAALRRAGNVALLEFLEKDQPGQVTQADRTMPVILQQRSPPAPQIAAAARALGPFTLPKVPDRVSRFWTFDENAGGAASLPVVTLMSYAEPAMQALQVHWPGQADDGPLASPPASLIDPIVNRASDRAAATLARLRQAVSSWQQTEAFTARHGAVLASVIAALEPPGSRYLNFYGPAQTVQTVSYLDALRQLDAGRGSDRFAGKAVFVGVSSPVQWQLRDEFRTVFSDPVTGMDLSGSEILATAFANLLAGNSLRPSGVPRIVGTLMVWSLLVAVAVSTLRPLGASILLSILSLAYVYLTLRLFAGQFIWMPMVVPLAIVGPALLVAAVLWQNRDTRADIVRIQETFGRYLPQSTVKRLVQDGYRPLEDRRTVFGVCLITDAEGYTGVAERMPSGELVDLVNDYLEVIITQIRRHGGEVSDIKGDSVMAFWASGRDDPSIREAACKTLIDIEQAVSRWNDANPYGVRLPTRVGLHCGSMTLARVGAADHFEQRAVGDIVNTASRLEQLNKELGTRLLASAEVVGGIDGIATRDLGSFLLKGRAVPIDVCELLGGADA